MNVPQLRFKGFEGEWQKISLNGILEFKNGLNYLKSDNGVTVFTVGVKNFNQKRLYSTDELEKVALNSLPNRDYQVEKGDLLFVRSNGNKELVGRMMISELDIENIYFSGFVIRGRVMDENKVKPLFMLYSEDKVKIALKNLTGGTNISNLSQSILNSITVNIPQVEEQEKITSFLLGLNKKIEKQQEKIEKLEQFKKGMMQKIFSQELRFKDEDGGEFPEWEEKRLKSLITSKRKGAEAKYVESGNILLHNDYLEFAANVKYVENEDDVTERDILILWDGSQAGNVYTKRTGVLGSTFVAISIKENYESYYIYHFLISNLLLIKLAWREGSGVPHVSKDFINNFLIKLPKSKLEQEKIAQFLFALDEKISKEKEKMTVLEAQKKGFMQGIFV